jgi:hypothetical protein
MRVVAWLTAFLVASACGAGAGAQTLEDMQRCRAITNDARRLACYDAIRVTSAPKPKYARVDLPELKNFSLSYRGDLVEVSGWIKPGGELFFLGLDAADERPMPLDVDAIPRRERQAFLSACGKGCEATVQGRVSPVNFTTGIVADTIVAH